MPTRNARPLETDEIRRQWQLSFDLTSHGIALVDPRTSLIQRVNPAFATMHGGTPDDFIGQPIAATLGPPWRQRVPELARTVHEQGYLRFECDRARLDGSIFPADVEVVAARDDQGALLYRLAFITDLTELRARETSERLAVERFERVFEDAPIGMVLVRAGRIERVNAEAAAVFGRTQDDMTGCDPRTLVHPEEAALTAIAHAALLEGRTPPPQDRRIVRPDGSVVHTRLTFTTLHERDDAGEPVSLVHIRDRSAEVEADQARAGALRLFATAVDQAPIGMCLVGLDGHFLRVNAALCRVLGRTEAELLAADFQELTHPHDLAADVALMHECLDGARDGYEMPTRFLTP
ncbi:MAG TPA: PAS domain S-box protein, partial [Sporichthya sp.]|nr:PAS domain S-box protein [Sporichthya sp.]